METLEVPEKILFIQTAFLGDAILSLPAIEFLKQKFPNSIVDVICNPKTYEVFSKSPFVNETIVLDKKKSHKYFSSLLKFAKKIKANNYARIYSAHRSLRTSIIVLLSEVKETYGFSNSVFNFIYKYIIPYKNLDHEVKRNLDLVSFPDKVDNWRVNPNVIVIDYTKRKISDIVSQYSGKKKIGIAPGSVWFTKRYPSEKYSIIVEEFVRMNHYVFLIGSADDRELCEMISSDKGDNVINFAGEFSFVETVELLKHCSLLISNDSAPTHMGICANIPVITVYCSTVPEFGFYPYNLSSTFVSNDLNCKPCGIHGYRQCPLSHFKCANELDEKIVIAKAMEILSVS